MAKSAIQGTTLTDLRTRYEDGSVKIDYGVFSPTRVYSTTGSITIDASLGANFKILDTSPNPNASGRTISVQNLKDGQSVSILVEGVTNRQITINATGDENVTLDTRFAAGQNGTMASAWSLFTIMRIGGTSGDGANFAVIGVMHGI